ncbi:DUF6714 family protein [Pedobacter jamesrossensis]|uniref:DUF6714 family protein n=1 Tax=Pedobacter jamesrossensis TaxID=1908238 RepID=A0ABV8NR78_9SPHI
MAYIDLFTCSSSLSFFDAKGMGFCRPKFLIFDISSQQIYEEQKIYSPDVIFPISRNLIDEYHKIRFSLFNNKQIQYIIHFLEFGLDEIIAKHKEYSANYGSIIDSLYSDNIFLELNSAIQEW